MEKWIFILLLIASQADAGAWPRSKGEMFIFASAQVSAPNFVGPVSTYTSSYIEYGLTEQITLGADIGHGISGRSKLVVFMRYPMLQRGAHVVSGELGLGKIAGATAIRPGVSYGYGFTRKNGTGWFAADLLFEHHIEMGTTDFKADLTYGRNHRGGFKSMLQLQTGKQTGDPSFARLAPSFVMPVGNRTHFELGVTAELRAERAYGLKIGLWRRF